MQFEYGFNKLQFISHTVEPPVRDHPKCEDLVVALREEVAYENRTTGVFFREEVWTHLP